MTAGSNDKPAASPSWRVALMMTLAAWLAAFAIVTALLSVFGDQLAALPLALRALLISGVVVIMMTRLVQPALSITAGRWAGAPHQGRSTEAQRSPRTDGATAPRNTHDAQSTRRGSSSPRSGTAK